MYGQENTSVKNILFSGKVFSLESKQPLEYATISLQKIGQENLVGTAADKNGKFEIQIESGLYIIKIEFLSFEPYI